MHWVTPGPLVVLFLSVSMLILNVEEETSQVPTVLSSPQTIPHREPIARIAFYESDGKPTNNDCIGDGAICVGYINGTNGEGDVTNNTNPHAYWRFKLTCLYGGDQYSGENAPSDQTPQEKSMISNWHRKGLTVPATLGVVACALLGSAGTASAGGNGQQIIYYAHHAYGQCTEGNNQNGGYIRNCTSSFHQGSNPDQGYWWIGTVQITWYRPGGSTVQSTCPIPQSQAGDFVTCYEPQ